MPRRGNSYADCPCWVAFRTGKFPPMKSLAQDDQHDAYTYFGASTVLIAYDKFNCTQYRNTTTLFDLELPQETSFLDGYGVGNCSGLVECFREGAEESKCRINVRMSALLTLTVCLMIKAAYMISVNISLRQSEKSQCLTFGDVIVASAMDRDTRIYNECMVNAGDGNRHTTVHTCHKHCKDRKPSTTGDSIGHCQKCKRYNIIDKAANLIHPSIAIKYKKSLISSLGTTALVQMITLMFCSLAMLAVSLFLAVEFGSAAANFKMDCTTEWLDTDINYRCTNFGKTQYLKDKFGTFGGFNSSGELSGPDPNTSEATIFLIANGAQVLYSVLYLLLTYNVTLISMESDWGDLERTRRRLRCTLVKGPGFAQSYLLQLPKKFLYPMMAFSSIMHWLLGQAISARETVYADHGGTNQYSEKSYYSVSRCRTLRESLH